MNGVTGYDVQQAATVAVAPNVYTGAPNVYTAAPQRMEVAQTGPARALPKELLEPLREELRRLIDAEAFVDNLPLLESTTRAVRHLIMTLSHQAHPAAPVGSMTGPMGSVTFGAQGGTVFGGSNPEQFGARAIRELVGLAPNIAQTFAKAMRLSPLNIIAAIASAREKGLTDLAERLEAALIGDLTDLVEKAEPSAPSAASSGGES